MEEPLLAEQQDEDDRAALLLSLQRAAASPPDLSISLVPATNAPPFHWLHTPLPCPCLPFSLCCERVVVCEEWLTQLPAPPRLLHSHLQLHLNRALPAVLAESPAFSYLLPHLHMDLLMSYLGSDLKPSLPCWSRLAVALYLSALLLLLVIAAAVVWGARWALLPLLAAFELVNAVAFAVTWWRLRRQCQAVVHAVMQLLRVVNAELLEAFELNREADEIAGLPPAVRLAQWRWVTCFRWRTFWTTQFDLCLVRVDEPPAREQLHGETLAV